MGRSILVYLNDETLRRLSLASLETGRDIQSLAEAAIEEAALEYSKKHGHEFGRKPQ